MDNQSREPVIVFDGFSYQYRVQTSPSLADIHLKIYEGEKVLILGPSGSGKSTLAHCINGLAPYFYPGTATGSLTIRGTETKELDLFRLSDRVGTVLQDPDGQFVGLTVAEDIAFRMENDAVPLPEMKERVRAAAEEAGILEHLEASPHSLSGGQKQRITVAGVISSGVGILLFDEPLANLDPDAGRKAIEQIDRIHRETGKTILIIEHRLEEALHRQVDRIIVIQEGRIVADLKPDELLTSPLLVEAGIREPLYLTALRYAGGEVEARHRPSRLDTMELGPFAERLKAWTEGRQSNDRLEIGATHERSHEPPLLELAGIGFGYEPGKPILRDVSLSIRKGERVGIVGKNGAGKSTLSKLICGFHKPTSGSIRYEGRDIGGDTIKERAQRVGFVLQNPNHMISKTLVHEEIALGLKARGIGEEETARRAQEALRVCGLAPYRNWPISALSFGQRKRVTIASVLVLQPEVLILDEPTAGQDYRHYNEMMEFIMRLREEGLTVLFITHDLHLLLEYTDRAIVLSDGGVLADAFPDDVLTDPELVREASLKETSLMGLARRAGLSDPRGFVRTFIAEDRAKRGRSR
ncbi:ATP-binding cassette domain-containing protein [Cohnella endophytica]|uniref:ATP-binding cassette domain-containing protein n=1 Tax=Cohnella endophytica TaxID=2419778 RepID=A0A494XK83_9BACL|nr:ABC transporter ATP-binding protein [Cohnella endophytica]RKP47963.1 ATP-binding cassette domain-containing protein [Cohnella endophytica]